VQPTSEYSKEPSV